MTLLSGLGLTLIDLITKRSLRVGWEVSQKVFTTPLFIFLSKTTPSNIQMFLLMFSFLLNLGFLPKHSWVIRFLNFESRGSHQTFIWQFLVEKFLAHSLISFGPVRRYVALDSPVETKWPASMLSKYRGTCSGKFAEFTCSFFCCM